MPFNEGDVNPPEVPSSAIVLTVNGHSHTIDVDPATPLLYVLSDDLALRGPKFGCGLGQCGAHGDRRRPRDSLRASRRSARSAGAEITTLEGLGTVEQPHPIQQAFIDEQAAQCGFCLSGVILTAKAFLDQNPKADRRADSAGAVGRAVPLLRAHAHAARDQDDTRTGEERRDDARRRARSSCQSCSRRAVVQLRRARRRSRVARSAARRSRRGRSTRSASHVDPQQLDSWIADRRRRHRHGVHRQVRARPGHAHRADAAGRRRTVGAARARHADSVRHRRLPGSGHDVGQPVDADELQRANLAQAAATAREALLAPRRRRGSACRVDQLTIADGVIAVAGTTRRDASATASWSAGRSST